MEADDALPRVQVPYYDFVLSVETDQAVRAELDVGKRTRSWGDEELVNAGLAEDLDATGAELGLSRSDGDEGLDWLVSDAASSKKDVVSAPRFHMEPPQLQRSCVPDLRIDAIARPVVGRKQVWGDFGGEVVGHARLLAPQEARHVDLGW